MDTIRARNVGKRAATIATALTMGVAVLLATVVTPPGTALACTPPPGGNLQKTIADRVAAADITLEGTIVALEGEFWAQVAKIRVDQYISGAGPALVTVSRYGPGSLCLSEVTLGQHAMFYTEETATGYQAFYLTQFDAVAPANPATIAEAVAAAGHAPTLPDPATRAVAPQAARAESTAVAAASATATSSGAGSSPPGWALAGLGMTGLASAGLALVRSKATPHRPG